MSVAESANHAISGNQPSRKTTLSREEKEKNYLTLKKKIIRTSELIDQYKDAVSKLDKTNTELETMRQVAKGLKKELQLVHQEKNQLTDYLARNQEEVANLRMGKREDEQLIQQLKAKLDVSRQESIRKESEKHLASIRALTDEKEKWRTMYQKLKKEFNTFKKGSIKNSSLSPLLSPTYLPSLVELTPLTLATPVSCVMENTENKSEGSLEKTSNAPETLVEQSISEEHCLDDAIQPQSELSTQFYECENSPESSDNHIVLLNEELSTQNTVHENTNVVESKPSANCSNGNTVDMPLVRPAEEEPASDKCERAPTSNSRAVPVPIRSEQPISAMQPSSLSLANQLFGDIDDSDDALSVSDDSSEDECDELAKMLTSNLSTPKEPLQMIDVPLSSDNKAMPTASPSVQDQQPMNTMAICNQGTLEQPQELSATVAKENSSPSSSEMEGSESSPNKCTGYVSSMAEGSKFIVPCVEVESVAADTLSSEDSDDEMNVSFPGSLVVLSPLPLSPVAMDTHDCSMDTSLSPLPVSPSNEFPLSPLPRSPNKAHQDDNLLSPLPPSPATEHSDFCVISPLPNSPVTNADIITPLPESPLTDGNVVTPLPASPAHHSADLTPLNFADTAPCGLQIPTPCNVAVMVTSQSQQDGETTPTRSELILSDGSPFSPPPLIIETKSYDPLNRSHDQFLGPCNPLIFKSQIHDGYNSELEASQIQTKPTIIVDSDVNTLGTTAACDKDNDSSTLRSDNGEVCLEQALKQFTTVPLSAAPKSPLQSTKTSFIGPLLPPEHPLNTKETNQPLQNSTHQIPVSICTHPDLTEVLSQSNLKVPSPPALSAHSKSRQLPKLGMKKNKTRKVNPFCKRVPQNNDNATSFDDLLKSFQKTSQVKNGKPTTRANTTLDQNASLSSLPTAKDLPPSKKVRLNSTSCNDSSALTSSHLPWSTPVQALPGYQGATTSKGFSSPTKEVPPAGYRLRSRKVDFYQTVKRRRQSSSSDSSPTKEAPMLNSGDSTSGDDNQNCSISINGALSKINVSAALAGSNSSVESSKGDLDSQTGSVSSPTYSSNSDSLPIIQSTQLNGGAQASTVGTEPLSSSVLQSSRDLHDNRSAALSDGELESDIEQEPTTIPIPLPPPQPVVMATRKRRHTDGATGQEEDQTPSSSPRQLLAQPLPQPDLSSVNCGYGQSRQAESRVELTASSEPIQSSTDDIFNTNIPLVGSSSTIRPQATPITTPAQQQSGLSLAQQQLPVWLQCPLPLPVWLVSALVNVQKVGSKRTHASVCNSLISSKKKRQKRTAVTEPLVRQNSQKPADYILVSLERLVSCQIHLSAIIAMFSELKNVSSVSLLVATTIKFLLHHYLPSITAVIQLHHEQCDAVRTSPHDRQPLDPTFPPALLKPECQLLAIFAHLPRTNPLMAGILSELSTALYQAIMTPGVKFHQLAAIMRLFTGVCRLQGDQDRVVFMCYDVMRKPLLVEELQVFASIASIWPLPLARHPGLKVQTDGIPGTMELEKQIPSFVFELVVMTIIREKAQELNTSLSPHMHTLCGWMQVGTSAINLLTERLLYLLTTSPAVYIDHPPLSPLPWRRPRPSVQAFHIVNSLRLIAHTQGWVWTNDTLIRAHLWPLLQKWNSSSGSKVKDGAAVCAVRLIGFVSVQGVVADPMSSSILQLQRVLIALLSKSKHAQDSFSALQLAAIDSLLELCPPMHPHAAKIVGVVRVWLNGLSKPAITSLAREFNDRLLTYRTTS